MTRAKQRSVLGLAAFISITAEAGAQVDPRRGVDPSVDYRRLALIAPWDDRNYSLRAADVALLGADEGAQSEGIPAFYRVELRRLLPGLPTSGPAQYPHSALPKFLLHYGGFLIDGQLYKDVEREADGWRVGSGQEALALPPEDAVDFAGETRVTSPNGGAESAVAIHPSDPAKVIAGTNGPGSGQKMFYSTNSGQSWTAAGALPAGSTCCDPTVAWSADGTRAYAAALGPGASDPVFVYRSADAGVTWTDLANEPGADPRREIGTGTDKEYLHVDRYATSPFKDYIYLTWHENNVLKFSRSTDFAHTWSTPISMSTGSAQSGIGSDITTDKNGNVYYVWPAFNSQKIWVRKSTDGGASFQTAVQVATTQGSFSFPIPSIETREVFIYNSADVDVSGGPYANSVYVAWTDSTAATGGVAANNHARIQVAYSRDGGTSWNVTTPHETADATTVDRWHEWLSVGPDGKVYVIFYDTRQNPARTSVDLYYAISADGAQTWSTPARLTSVSSPNLSDGFEFGDYNGLDVIMNQLIAIFTDNRDEVGGDPQSADVYVAAAQFTSSLLADGFESGTTTAWNAAVQ